MKFVGENNVKTLWSKIKSLLADKQDKNDTSLKTEDKTVVGAINEVTEGLCVLSINEGDLH